MRFIQPLHCYASIRCVLMKFYICYYKIKFNLEFYSVGFFTLNLEPIWNFYNFVHKGWKFSDLRYLWPTSNLSVFILVDWKYFFLVIMFHCFKECLSNSSSCVPQIWSSILSVRRSTSKKTYAADNSLIKKCTTHLGLVQVYIVDLLDNGSQEK